jgi:hypothetical protein
LRLRWGYARGVGGFYAKHASLRDRYALHRARREAGDRVGAVVGAVAAAEPKPALAEMITLAGMLVGAAEWMGRYRLRPKPRRNSS